MEGLDDQPRVKRFKYQSYSQSLKEVHLAAAHNRVPLEHEITDNDSHFHQCLDHWRQLNVSPSFVNFANKVEGMSASMPLLLHNWRDIAQLWIAGLESSDDETLRAFLDLLQKMAHDLRTTLSPLYPQLLSSLLQLLPRPISPAALTALLETFASLFKYLLVPAVHTTLLERTWADVRMTLQDCLPEIRRAMAEVWASVIRRLKISAREKAVYLLAQDIEGMEDTVAWVFVFATKSVSQTLHTATTSILTPLLAFYLSADTPRALYTLLRRVITALIHHVKNAEQFGPVADLLIKQFVSVVKAMDSSSPQHIERLRRMLELITVPSAVRQGSRLTQNQLEVILAELPNLPLDPILYPALLGFLSAAFIASEVALWLGPGRSFLQRVWSLCKNNDLASLGFAFRLHMCLAELGWGGWKQVALPLLMKATATQELLHVDPPLLFGFLATLKKARKLGLADTDHVWRTRVEKVALAQLGSLALSTGREAAVELNDILTLSSLFSPSISPAIISIVERLFAEPHQDTLADFRQTPANSAWALGLCMQTLVERDVQEWTNHIDLGTWVKISVKYWGWSPDVLSGLHSLCQASPASISSVRLEDVYPALQTSLLSHLRPLRLSVLRLIGSNAIVSPSGASDVIRRCLQGEEVPLDVQGVRERVLRIGRVGQILKDDDGVGADISTRWLLAQLKVNLRPIWSPAAGAISSLSERFGDIVWRLLFDEMKGVSGGRDDGVSPEWLVDVDEGNIMENWEDERSWRDPSAHKLLKVVSGLIGDEAALNYIIKVQSQTLKGRLDIQSYETQLLLTLGECSTLVEKHNREVIPHFLTLAGPDAISKFPRQKLVPWLSLFSKFHNPKALHATEALYALYLSLISHPDRSLQKVALSCIFTYKSPKLSPHEDKLMALLDDTRWREELSSLDFSELDPQERSVFVDIVIRLLFGIMLEKRGRTRGADRRTAVLGTLAGCTDDELSILVDLMLRPFGSSSYARQERGFVLLTVDSEVLEKHQTGFLVLLGDVMKNLGPKLLRYWPTLIGTTMDLVGSAQKKIEKSAQESDDAEAEEEEDVGEVEETAHSMSSSKIVRSIRQLGLKRFADFFRSPVTFDFTPFMEAAFSFISPRVDYLDKENTQAPSALLELFYTWSLEEDYVKYLVGYDARVLPKIYDCLVASNVKPAVINRIFDIVDQLLLLSSENEEIRDQVVKPHISHLLSNLAVLLHQTKGVTAVANPLSEREIKILSKIAVFATDSNQASALLKLFTPLLRKSVKLIPERVKVDILKIITDLMPLIPDLSDSTSEDYRKIYLALSELFHSLRSRSSRLELSATFQKLAELDPLLKDLAALLESLNAYSTKRIDEPDFDRRLAAFAALNDVQHQSLSSSHWTPVLYNMLYFVQDPVELAIRTNASFALRHFIDVVAVRPSSDYETVFLHTLYPGVKNGLRSKNELVRTEVLSVLGYAVGKCQHLVTLQEMKGLLAGGDEEANFFNNILHVQIHRRSRALRRLADYCDEGHLRSSTLADIFVPLVGNYITSTTSVDHHLVNDSILATARMAKHLGWGAYYALVQKYLKLSKIKDATERISVRALVAILGSFHFVMEEPVPEETLVQEEEEDPTGEQHQPVDVVPAPAPNSRIADAVSHRLLPELLNHLEKRDPETDDNARIPISLGIVSIAQHLPAVARETQITRLLTVLSQVFRSRSQDTRDLVRDTLCRIAVILGPGYMPLILKELRAALLRGPQLHVLAFVAHALLVHVTSGDHAQRFNILDDCVADLAHVSAEVIFGESGKDVQAEDFKTKMREVRSSSSKGLDVFAILAKHITPGKISALLLPLRSIMQETESVKVMNLVEEVLKRIAQGLNSNKHLVPTELLALCNTLISQNAKFLQQTAPKKKHSKGAAIVQLKREEAHHLDHYATNSFRFVVFGLDLLHTALRRNRFDFHDSSVMVRLDKMIVVVGNTLYSTSAPVLLLGLRCAAGLAKCPLKSLEKTLPVSVRQSIDIIQQIGSTDSEVVQVALKSLATIFRESPSIQVKEKDLVYLLELLSPDLEDSSRQASVFTMLRAIIARRFVVPEIYDIMDRVSEIMVTSQSSQVQELCRGVLLQFLLEYPQGKGRLRNQMTFLTQNLAYVHESGRKSVMELLGAVISKFEPSLIQEYSDLLFVGLVMVVANDESAKCREMASVLIKSLFSCLDDERRQLVLSHLHAWASQQTQPRLVQVSSQIYGFIVDILRTDCTPFLETLVNDLTLALKRSRDAFDAVEVTELNSACMPIDLDWQVPYQVLSVFEKVLRVYPEIATQSRVPWDHIVRHLLFPHAWVRTASSRLVGLLFAAVPAQPPGGDYSDSHPLSVTGLKDVANKLASQLKSDHLDETLSLQVVKNLFYIGKTFYALGDTYTGIELPDDDEEKDTATVDPLPWLFSKLSYQIRSAHISRRNRSFHSENWSQQPLAVLRWFAAMTSHMDRGRLEKFLVHILTPVYRLLEDDTIRDRQMEELKTLATELQDMVQTKVGVTAFSATYTQIRQSVLGVRRERKTAKALQVATNPEAAAKRKMQRNAVKKESRKRKNRSFADRNGKLKRQRGE